MITTSTSDHKAKIMGLTEVGLELLVRKNAVRIANKEELLKLLDPEQREVFKDI